MADVIAVRGQGNNVLVLFDDGSQLLAYKSRSNYWIVRADGDTPTPGGDYRFPFRRSRLNLDSYYGHSGIDWPGGNVGNAASIRAVGPGTVQAVYTNPVNNPEDFSEPTWRGNCVVINHGVIGGITIWSLYAHMRDAPTLSVGDTVEGGQIIGRVGNTGASNGAHLHFEIIYNGTRLPTSTPGNNTPGLGFQRTLDWLDANAVGYWA